MVLHTKRRGWVLAGLVWWLVTGLVACGGGGGNGGGGIEGEDAATTSTVIVGHGAPDDALGSDGAFYFDQDQQVMYGPRTDGRWPAGVSFEGEPGADGKNGKDGVDGKDGKDGKDGVDGVDGVDGQDGTRLHSGIAERPDPALGVDGDFYLHIGRQGQAVTLYGPKAAGGWPDLGVSLIGPPGEPGVLTGALTHFYWSITATKNQNVDAGKGTYYLTHWNNGLWSYDRWIDDYYDVMVMPIKCRRGQLMASTSGQLGLGARYTFTVLHRDRFMAVPGNYETFSETPLRCELSQRSCEGRAQLGDWNVGDLVIVRMEGNLKFGLGLVHQPIAVSFMCMS